jgi:hypothetical protein
VVRGNARGGFPVPAALKQSRKSLQRPQRPCARAQRRAPTLIAQTGRAAKALTCNNPDHRGRAASKAWKRSIASPVRAMSSRRNRARTPRARPQVPPSELVWQTASISQPTHRRCLSQASQRVPNARVVNRTTSTEAPKNSRQDQFLSLFLLLELSLDFFSFLPTFSQRSSRDSLVKSESGTLVLYSYLSKNTW